MIYKPYTREFKPFTFDIINDIRRENPYLNVNFPDVDAEWLDAYAILCAALNEASRIFKKSPEIFGFMSEEGFEILCKVPNPKDDGFSDVVEYIISLAAEDKWDVLQGETLKTSIELRYHRAKRNSSSQSRI